MKTKTRMSRRKMTEEEKKSKLTVNINENLLKKVDELVEKNEDKRSRLIERLLNDYIQEKNI